MSIDVGSTLTWWSVLAAPATPPNAATPAHAPRAHARAAHPSVLITGAGGGIGRALVARFTAAGWTVHASERKSATLPLDVTDDASVLAARAQVGVPDVVINNAGLGLLGPMAELPDEVLARQYDVNVRGLARVTRAFAPTMARRGHGRIINVGSLAGVLTLPWFGAYSATKYAVEAVSDALRLELAPFGVPVVLVEPSVVGTGFVDAAVASLEQARANSTWHAALAHTLANKDVLASVAVTPEQVAEVVFRAATTRRPRARYRVGALASLLLRLAALLPTGLRDRLLRGLVGLHRPARAAPLTLSGDSPV